MALPRGRFGRLTSVLLALCPLPFALVWAIFTGLLAVGRHMNLQTNAFDLGYVSQALWYDAHGEPFRFTTIQGVSALLEGVDPSRIRHPHWLLAFHVEPALLLLAPLYRLWSDPRLLLWLQACVVAAGALPAAWLASRLIGSQVAAIAFGLAWLLAPGLEGAVLSDFHMVALGATFLMVALWLLETGHPRWALAFFALTALSREDAAAAVAWLGVVLLVRDRSCHPERSEGPASLAERILRSTLRMTKRGGAPSGLPLALVAGAGGWALLCVGVVEPFFSGGASAFSGRYSWLIHDPFGLGRWLSQPDVLSYLGLQLLAGGVVVLLAPLELAAALPLLAINALSSFDWMRSGGGHYSALLVPLLLWAGMHGLRRLKCWAAAKGVLAGSGLVVASAVLAQAWVGASPLRPGFSWPSADPRAPQALAALGAVPAGAAVTATSALYPHLSARHDAYWFPATSDADWFALDVAGTTHPLSPADMRDAALKQLSRTDVELVEARDGVLVLHRHPGAGRDGLLTNDPADRTLGSGLRDHPELLPAEFYGFATMTGPRTPISPIHFGPLELFGYELQQLPQVGLLGNSATLATYWRATAPVSEDLRFAVATTRAPDGALSGIREDAAATPLWLPTSHWQPGQSMRLEMSLGEVRGVQAVGVAVEDRAGHRLAASGEGAMLWDSGTIAAVARLS
ncbi:MAG: DUF2079 domain-containing protein [Chloroflexota bacterium]